MTSTVEEVTRLLAAIREGDRAAIGELFPLVYNELHTLAHRQLKRFRPGQTLDTTALVHEAYLRLVDPSRCELTDRAHFLGVTAIAMRQILVDHARSRTAQKRGGNERPARLSEVQIGVDGRALEILAIDEALEALTAVDERLSRLVELRFFGGLTVGETAEVLDVSERTVKREWRKARAFLYRKLHGVDASWR